jgi:PPOX class probable F420-dependent enzyme
MPDADLARRVAAARVARLATIDPDGRPHVVPICFALAEGVLYSAVDRKPKRSRDLRRLRNLRERGWATVLVDHYEEDWSALWWVRLRGRARVLEDGDESREALALLAGKYPQYRREPPPGPVVAVDVTEWRAWTGGSGTG